MIHTQLYNQLYISILIVDNFCKRLIVSVLYYEFEKQTIKFFFINQI